MKRHLVVLSVCFVLNAGAAAAQEKGQVGLAMGIPSTIAIIWHPSDTVAIRPEIGFSKNSSESDSSSGLTVQSDTWNVSFGASALIYFKKVDNLHPYFSPRFTYTRASSHIETDFVDIDSESTVNQYATSGSIGAQYAINRRFGAFGEVGLVYSHQNQKSTSGAESSLNSFGTRSSVGVILYF